MVEDSRTHVPEELVEAFWRHYQLLTSADRSERLRADEFAWAGDYVDEAVRDPVKDVVPILLALSEAATGDSELAYLGAGPIEDLLKFGNDARVAELAVAVRQNPTLARARTNVSRH
jgi:hypothetical protein